LLKLFYLLGGAGGGGMAGGAGAMGGRGWPILGAGGAAGGPVDVFAPPLTGMPESKTLPIWLPISPTLSTTSVPVLIPARISLYNGEFCTTLANDPISGIFRA
jgi:hypothetical protein